MTRRRALLSAALLAAASPASAQVFDTQLSLSADSRYEDNFLRLPPRAPTPPGRSRSEVVHSLAAGFMATAHIGLQQLYAGADVGIERLTRNEGLDDDFYSGQVGLRWRLRRLCEGDVGATLRRRRSDPGDVVGIIANRQEQRGVRGSGGCLLGGTWRATLEASAQKVENSAAQLSLADRRDTSVSATLAYEDLPLMKIGVQAGATRRRYPARDGLTGVPFDPPVDGGNEQKDVRLVLDRRITPKLTFTGRVGLSRVDGAGAEDLTTETLDARLGWQVGPKLSLDLSGGRAVESADTVVSSFVIAERVQLRADWAFSPKLAFGATAAYEERDFRGGVLESGAEFSRKDKTKTGGVEIAYSIYRGVGLRFSYRYIDRNSTLSLATYTTHQAGVGISVTY